MPFYIISKNLILCRTFLLSDFFSSALISFVSIIAKYFFLYKGNLSSKNSDGCETIGIFMTTTYTDGTVERILLRTYEECPATLDDGDDGTGGGGEGGNGDSDLGIIVPDCRSFEFANGFDAQGRPVKAAAVANIVSLFISGGFNSDGVFYTDKLAYTPLSFFTVPVWMTNGQAANLAALTLGIANDATQVWFLGNPTASNDQLAIEWNRQIKEAFRLIGGSYSQTDPPFSIPSPAPYQQTYAGDPNNICL